ncbi:hypothetical protein HZH66_009653 [Vespula vulgaris]|uniref:Uncharacterized protein n=1 Tax=Vespula vulgaris TaxID=7454 RepID=A0A834N1W2_VESVU|nr:hypothetical protein HZH66_009653 [Vespula vulgaris]
MFGVNLGSGTMGTIKNLSAYTTTNTTIRGERSIESGGGLFHVDTVDIVISQTSEYDKNRLYVLYYTKIVISQKNISSHGESTSTLDLKLLHKGEEFLAYGMCFITRSGFALFDRANGGISALTSKRELHFDG